MLPYELTIPQVTILTPTWNRRHLLPRLYDSLVEQNVPHGSFEWLVVDDGSNDGSADWLETLIREAPFRLRVIRQENGGKHRALNRGAKLLETPWVIVVDSDDWLLPGAVEQVLSDTAAVPPELRAIIAPLRIEGRPQRFYKTTKRLLTHSEWRRYGRVGDSSMIMRSEVLRKHPFPEFPGEKFMAEGALYAPAFGSGGIRLTNRLIVGAEYQADGLSARSLVLRSRNPLGALSNYRAILDARPILPLRLRHLVNFHRFYVHATQMGKRPADHGFRPSPFFLPLGWICFLYDRLRLLHVIDQ